MPVPRTIKVGVEPVMSEEWHDLLASTAGIEGDVIEKVNAGAALVYALYHAGVGTTLALPTSVTNALERAQRAYGVGHR